MYPITFDNPNQRKAANRNVSADDKPAEVLQDPDTDDSGADIPEELFSAHDDVLSNNLLVVECRSDDKWRVALCTDLSELDAAMDTARSLRGSADVDEVCLTLEMSGQHGRESRREVLRFGPESSHAHEQPLSSVSPVSGIDDEALSILGATLKVPDYNVDDLDFSDFIPPMDPENSIRVELPVEPSPSENSPPEHNPSGRERLEGRDFTDQASDDFWGDEPDDDADLNAAERLEIPIMAHGNGLAAKMLVFGGAIALLILGGALAELLAVDITSSANAGVGIFDTYSSASQ